MNSDRRNIAMTFAFLAGFLFVGQATAQQNRNADSGKKSQQSQIARQNSGTSQPNRTKQSQLPQQRTQAGRAVSGQPATPQSNSTGRHTPAASSGTRNSGTANSGTLRQSSPSTGSGTPARASASPHTGNTRSPANAAPSSRNPISPQRTNPTDLGTNPARQPPANRPTRPETNETGAGSTSPSSPAAKPARPTSNASTASSSGTESASRTAGIDSGTGTVAPTEQMVPKSGRTALEAYGEEVLKGIGLPEEFWNLDSETALYKGRQKIVRDENGIPKGSTQNMAPEDMLNAVANLAILNAEEHKKSEKFWADVSSGGLDAALGPIAADELGLPKGVRAGSPASKILDDAGQLATVGLDLSDRGSWTLLNEFQNGKLTPDQFVDRVNQIKAGRNGSGGGTVGGAQSGNGRGGAQSPNSPPGTDKPGIGGLGGTLPGGQDSTGKSTAPTDPAAKPDSPPVADSNTTPPGSRGGNTGGRGTTPGTGSTPPGSQNSSTPAPGGSNSGSNSETGQSGSGGSTNPRENGGLPGGKAADSADDGMTAEAQLGSGTYVIVTHNDDGSYTADLIETDANGNSSVVGSETFADADGDGTYTGDKGGESGSKPKEGLYEGKETEAGTTYEYETETSSSDSTDSTSSGDEDSADADADVDTSDVDEYTPGRDGEYIMPLAQRLKYMQSLMQALNDTKWNPGKGGTDSTPNPMNESFGGGTVPWNPKDSVVRPVDGTSSSGIVPAEAIQQIQDPNAVQGGVIDPVKNKDKQ